jgi:protein involved in polysaccharide export with SLBB domain
VYYRGTSTMRQEVKMLGARTCRFRFGATALLCAALCSGVLSAQTPQYRVEGPNATYYEYFIYPGDVLRISVHQHSELSRTVVVMPNGEINLPWLNSAQVAGLSVQAATDLLRQELQSVGNRSCVTVTVQRRKGPWVLQREPFFIDVPPPSRFNATKMTDS